jgi:membrane protein DedA with SNARE-associated domain
MSNFVDQVLTGVSGPVAYLLVFLVPALEASVFVGFVFPAETVVLLGGVLAAQHRVSIGGVIAAAVAGAVIGDSIGYGVGHRFGEPLQHSRLGRIVGPRRWHAAEDFLRRRGGPAVLLGRWTALLRALIPAAAGMAGLRYRTFLVWNATGGVVWGTAVVIAGFAAGNAYKRLEQYLGRGTFVLLAIVVAGLVGRHYWVKRRRQRRSGKPEPS